MILTPPLNWQFRAGSGSVHINGNATPGGSDDLDTLQLSVLSTGLVITLSTDATSNRIDTLSLTGIQVRPITGNLAPSSGNILRTCTNSGTLIVSGIVCNSTNFGILSMSNAALTITKTASTGIIYSGTTVVYTITYTNTGPNNTSGVIITDFLPSYINFVSASTGTYSGGTHTLIKTGLTVNV